MTTTQTIDRLIPVIPLVTVEVRLPNERLWELHAKCAARTATPDEIDELDAMCAQLEAQGDTM